MAGAEALWQEQVWLIRDRLPKGQGKGRLVIDERSIGVLSGGWAGPDHRGPWRSQSRAGVLFWVWWEALKVEINREFHDLIVL